MKKFNFYKITECEDYITVLDRWHSSEFGSKIYFLFVSPFDKASDTLMKHITNLHGEAAPITALRGDDDFKKVFIVDSIETPELFSMRCFDSLVTRVPTLLTVKRNSKVIVEDYPMLIYDQFFNNVELESITA